MRSHLVITVLGAFILGALAGAGGSSDLEPTASPVASDPVEEESEPEPVEEEEPEPEPEPEPEIDPEPQGDYALATCDLGSDDKLIGSTEVINTGDVPASLGVSFKWLLGDGSAVKAENKQVTLPPGRERYVFFEHPADIDLQLSFQDHPDYFDGDNCKTKVNISS